MSATPPDLEVAVLTSGNTLLRMCGKEVALTPAELRRLLQMISEALAVVNQEPTRVPLLGQLH
jgi:hypothetical protein